MYLTFLYLNQASSSNSDVSDTYMYLPMHTLVSVNRELHIPYIGIPTTYIRYSNLISTELSPVLRRRGEREGDVFYQ